MSAEQKSPIINSPFAKYGHDCTLDDLPDEFEYGDISSTGFINKFRRWLIRMCVVSESSKMYTNHIRSMGAIVKERRRQVLNYTCRIHPFSTAYFIWSVIMVFTTGLLIFIVALEFLYYDVDTPFLRSTLWHIIGLFADTILLINILFSFITGYYNEPKQEVVLGAKLIAINYLKTFFILDLLSCYASPINILSRIYDLDKIFLYSMNVTRYVLIVRFRKHFKYCAEVLDTNYYTYTMSTIVVCTLMYWHVVCCMLKYLRQILCSPQNRIFIRAITTADILEKESKTTNPSWNTLIGAFYRGSLIIYNSSYGRILPSNEIELILVWSIWYASTMFFIYILAMIMEIKRGRTSATHKYVEMERQLKDYMRHKQLPMHMRSRILIYYEFRFQKCYFRESEILDTISEQLRQEINMHACRKLVENVIFFRNLPINLLVRIISCLRIEIYLVNDVIIKANTPGTSMYFISTGTVSIITKSGKEICHLEDGSHFGEIALIIKGMLRTASVIAVEVSEIYRLDQKDFVKAISPYPDLLANIQHISAERMEVAFMLDDYNKKEHSTKR